jgi:hypothetical protein
VYFKPPVQSINNLTPLDKLGAALPERSFESLEHASRRIPCLSGRRDPKKPALKNNERWQSAIRASRGRAPQRAAGNLNPVQSAFLTGVRHRG